MIDLHCHIIPGLDDGAQTLDEAVDMARIAASDGIRRIVGTPHLFRSPYDDRSLQVADDARRTLNDRLREEKIPVEILSGAEVRVSHNLISEVRKNRARLVVNGSAYMFLEFPSDHVFPSVNELFFELQSEGIIPIIAHPERNMVFARHPEMLYELIQGGALAQANSGSVMGLYGPETQHTVFGFLEHLLIHFLASDGHNTRSKAPRLSPALERLKPLIGEKRARALVEDYPGAVIEDQGLFDIPEPLDPGRKEKKIKIKFPSFFKNKS